MDNVQSRPTLTTQESASTATPDISKLLSFSLSLGVGILIGWKCYKLSNAFLTPWTKEWMRPHRKLVLVVCTDKAHPNRARFMAHCSSASILAMKTSFRDSKMSLLLWTLFGQTKVVLKVDSTRDLDRLREAANKKLICTALIKERSPNACTSDDQAVVLAIGPAPSTHIDHITGGLKLY